MQFSDMWGTRLDVELVSDDRTARFTTALRKAYVNEGAQKFNEQTGCYTDRVSIDLEDGVGEYDLVTAGVVPNENYLRPAKASPSVAITTIADGSVRYIEGAALPWVSEEALNQQGSGWRARGAATPGELYVRQKAGSLFLGLTPAPAIPATETWALLWPYVAIPPTMTADDDVPFNGLTHLSPYHDRIVAYAAAQLEKLRKNYPMVDRHLAFFAAGTVLYRQDQAPPTGARVRMLNNPRGTLRRGYGAIWGR